MEPVKMWVDGKEVPGKADVIPVEDPATGEIFAVCHAASPDDVNRAVQIAHDAFQARQWSSPSSRHLRADVLDRAASLLTAHLPELIALEVRQTGRPIREMRAQVPGLVRWFRYYAAVLRTEERAVLPTTGSLHNWVDRVPLGVVVLITPFNHPLLIAVKKLAPALAAGNAVILKPSELTPLTSLRLGKILKEAGVPDGIFNVLPGVGKDTGAALAGHRLVRKVDVTGSTSAGRAIGALAGSGLARFNAELGGKAPSIVFRSANIDAAVNGIAFGAFVASGQTCVAATRVIVDIAILKKVADKLKAKAASIESRMGSPANEASMMGPVISAWQLAGVEELVNQAVNTKLGRVLHGGHRMRGESKLDGTDFSKGYFYAPTILVPGERTILFSRIWREEAFGPVIILDSFDGTEEDALKLANDTFYGLGAAIWTGDLSQAFRVSEKIEAGIVWVNTHHRNDPSSPWGAHGEKPESGVGTENGLEAYRAYTAAKSTIINYADQNVAATEEDWFREDAGQVRYG